MGRLTADHRGSVPEDGNIISRCSHLTKTCYFKKGSDSRSLLQTAFPSASQKKGNVSLKKPQTPELVGVESVKPARLLGTLTIEFLGIT